VASGNAFSLIAPLEGLTSVAKVVKSSQPYDQKVLGIVSENPSGEVSGQSAMPYMGNPKPVALVGRVGTKVSTENGPIAVGDPITTSSIPGVGMKATQSGPIVGKALEAYDNSDPTAVSKIMVFVHIGWYVAPLPDSGLPADATFTSINTETLTAGTINTDILFVGDRQLTMGPAGELVVDGSVNVLGDIKVSGDLQVDGDILGTALTVDKINVSTGNTEPVSGKSSDSVGSETIVAGQTEILIETTAVTTDSKIFVTPTSTTLGQSPYVIEKVDKTSFKVKIDAAVGTDIKFDWLIIN